MGEPIISVSGLRGIIGAELTPLTATKYVAAYCSQLPEGAVVISRDGRESGPILVDVISATLQAHGHRVLDLGIAATPTVGVEVRARSAVAGIQVSASHNPREYNGIKLFNSEGRVIPASDGRKVLDAYQRGLHDWCRIDRLERRETVADPHATHLASVLKIVRPETIASKRYRVYLESNHGAGSLLGKRLLESLGCQVTVHGDQADGLFEHPPEPLAENLREVSRATREGGFDVAFCQDPDADRLAILDEQGQYIGEEYTVALCLREIFSERAGPVVINCASSSMSRVLCQKHGVPCHLSAVGEANVVDRMRAEGAIFGGEGNGGPIDPRVGLVRDSFVGMALVLGLMARTGQSLGLLAKELPAFGMVKSKAQMDAGRLQASLEKISRSFPDARVDRQDGVRLDWLDRWILLRGSNTEPIVRLIAEAPDARSAEALIQRVRRVLES
jgi:phosphomannomutase